MQQRTSIYLGYDVQSGGLTKGNLMKFVFTVPGTCVPYTRTTQKQKWVDARWKKYADYKTKIQANFFESVKEHPMSKYFAQSMIAKSKPLDTKQTKVYVSIKMFFKNKQHGDPDNIYKGAIDALFVSDKYIAGFFDFDYDEISPRLEVTICKTRKEWLAEILRWNKDLM